ncbi:MAG: hypothetical protein WD468_12645 [Pirellulales bacterium]
MSVSFEKRELRNYWEMAGGIRPLDTISYGRPAGCYGPGPKKLAEPEKRGQNAEN